MRKIHLKVINAIFFILIGVSMAHAQAADPKGAARERIKDEEFTYECDGVQLKGYVAYIPTKDKQPAILVVPEWWGYGEYTKMRARMLAQLGYFAMAVDIYGGGKQATTVAEAQNLSEVFYKDPKLAEARLEAAEKKVKRYPQVDATKVGAIGYCFGGTMVLNAAKLGMDLKAVVSFHGGLKGGVPAKPGVDKARILICHGGADKFSSEEDVKAFKANLDSASVHYGFKVYPGAMHAFTNPEATANGKKFNIPIAYNLEADKQSWIDMTGFLKGTFAHK